MDLNKLETPGTVQEFSPGLELQRLKVDPLAETSEPPIYCRILNPNGTESPVMTAGNFSLCIGRAKSRKTFFLVAILPALIKNKTALGRITGSLPDGQKNIIYFDTEQSSYHLSRTIKRICHLAGEPEPENLTAYGLRPLSPAQRLQLIEYAVNTAENVGLIIIDGIRDLCQIGINDEKEATELTSKFLKWTYESNNHLILVLHQNKNDLNARGHLGSESTHKAETVFSIQKDSKAKDISIVQCEYSRDIEFEPFAFTIIEGLPVECDMPQGPEENRRTVFPDTIENSIHIEILQTLFRSQQAYKYLEIISGIKNQFAQKGIRFGDNKTRDFVNYYKEKGWIYLNGKGYERNIAIF